MSSPNALRGHNVINNGVKDIYRNVIKRYFDTVIKAYLNNNKYKSSWEGWSACRLHTLDRTFASWNEIKIRESAVYIPEKEIIGIIEEVEIKRLKEVEYPTVEETFHVPLSLIELK